MRTAAIVLAAGASMRMGTAKQLLELDGKPLVRRAAETALAAGFQPVVVVIGSSADAVAEPLKGIDVEIVRCDDWARGLGASIRAGVRHVRANHADTDAILLTLCDQPRVTAGHLKRLATAAEGGAAIVACRYGGSVGVPALFARPLFVDLEQTDPAAGAKAIILAHRDRAIVVDVPEAAIDVDTRGDYDALKEENV